jgi:hypothetical protein
MGYSMSRRPFVSEDECVENLQKKKKNARKKKKKKVRN